MSKNVIIPFVLNDGREIKVTVNYEAFKKFNELMDYGKPKNNSNLTNHRMTTIEELNNKPNIIYIKSHKGKTVPMINKDAVIGAIDGTRPDDGLLQAMYALEMQHERNFMRANPDMVNLTMPTVEGLKERYKGIVFGTKGDMEDKPGIGGTPFTVIFKNNG